MRCPAFFLTSLFVLVGCGGGGHGGSARSAKIAVSVTWPSRGRLVPAASQSVVVSVLSGAKILGTGLVARPTDESNTVSVVLGKLPAGAVTLHAVAYPTADGSGVAQAEGNTSVTLVAGETTAAPLTMDSRVATLEVAPVTVVAGDVAGATPTVSAKDAAGATVLLKVGDDAETIDWSTADPSVATVTGALVTGVAPGATTVTAKLTTKDDGTTVSGSAAVTVTPAKLLYRVTSLGVLGGTGTETGSTVSGINASGQLVGSSGTASKSTRAFRYSNGVMTDLGALDDVYSVGNAISSSGQIVGYSKVASGDLHSFLWTNGTMQDLGNLSNIGSNRANAINDAEQIAGYSNFIGSGAHAYLYSGGVMKDLGTFGGVLSIAQGIDADGSVVGFADLTGNLKTHAFLYANDRMQDLGAFGGDWSSAYAIRDGKIVGASTTGTGETHAFLYEGGTMRDLGKLDGLYSYAYGLNGKGQVVGESTFSSGRSSHGFIYSDGKMQDLNALMDASGAGWEIIGASSINDRGEIAAVGYSPEGAARAVLLTPVK